MNATLPGITVLALLDCPYPPRCAISTYHVVILSNFAYPALPAKRYYNAGCGFDAFGASTMLPAAVALPLETAESETLVGDKDEETHLQRSIDAFIKKDYRKAIEHAKQHTDQYVVSRIVGVSSCALKDKDGIREALEKSDDEGKELIKYACNHYKAAVE
jgi:hypothetical protein